MNESPHKHSCTAFLVIGSVGVSVVSCFVYIPELYPDLLRPPTPLSCSGLHAPPWKLIIVKLLLFLTTWIKERWDLQITARRGASVVAALHWDFVVALFHNILPNIMCIKPTHTGLSAVFRLSIFIPNDPDLTWLACHHDTDGGVQQWRAPYSSAWLDCDWSWSPVKSSHMYCYLNSKNASIFWQPCMSTMSLEPEPQWFCLQTHVIHHCVLLWLVPQVLLTGLHDGFEGTMCGIGVCLDNNQSVTYTHTHTHRKTLKYKNKHTGWRQELLWSYWWMAFV